MAVDRRVPRIPNLRPSHVELVRDSGTSINASEEAALDHLEQYVDALPDDEDLTREDVVAHLMDQGSERPDARAHVGRR